MNIYIYTYIHTYILCSRCDLFCLAPPPAFRSKYQATQRLQYPLIIRNIP